MVVHAPALISSAPAQLITAPAQPPATGVVVYTALFFHMLYEVTASTLHRPDLIHLPKIQ